MITVSGMIDGIRSLKDKTIKIGLALNECDAATVGQIYAMDQTFGYFAIKPEMFTAEDIKKLSSLEVDIEEIGGKSRSQRLRNVLYRWYEQQPQGYQDFESFYAAKMERFIDHIKDKLD